MDPNQQQQPPAPQPYNNGANYGPPAQQTPAGYGQIIPEPAPPHKSRLPIIIGAIAGVLLMLTIGLVLLLSGSKKPAKQAAVPAQTNKAQGPAPATAIGVEQTSNSISQDLSGLNDDKDLPSTMLDDKPLGL